MKYLPQNKVKDYRQSNMPERCPIFDITLEKAVLDHSHKNFLVRGVIDDMANQFLGKIENAWKRYGNQTNLSLQEVLSNIISYLNNPKTDVLHPVGFRQMVRKFKYLPLELQIKELNYIDCDPTLIENATNNTQRTILYKTQIKKICTNI
jgi:hypothetical protein